MWYALCVQHQDQGEEDQQPSIVRRQHPQGQHGGGGGDPAGARPGKTGMQCVCIAVGLPGVLLDLLDRVRNIVQTLHTRGKVCKVSCQIFADFAHSSQLCKVRQMHTFSEKVCTKSAQSVQSMHVFCTKSAYQQ